MIDFGCAKVSKRSWNNPIGLYAPLALYMWRLLKCIWPNVGQHWDKEIEAGRAIELHEWKEKVYNENHCGNNVLWQVEILDTTDVSQWQHWSGINIPADIGTKAISLEVLKRSEWLTGPVWLEQPEIWMTRENKHNLCLRWR